MTAFIVFQAAVKGFAKVSGCLWAFGLRGNVFDWVERVTLFGDELPPFDKLLGLFSIFRLPILWAAFFVRAC